MLLSNNDVILRSDGVKKAKNAVILNIWSLIITDNEAQGQSAKFVDANGVIFCQNCHERLRDFHYLPKD